MAVITRQRHIRARPTTNRLWGEDAVLIQEAAGRRDPEGNWTPGAATRLPIRCAVNPVSADRGGGMALDLASGDAVRLSEMRQFTMTLPAGTTPIAPTRPTERTGGDKIEWNNRAYRVISVSVWGDDFYVALGAREDPQPERFQPAPRGRFGGRFGGRYG